MRRSGGPRAPLAALLSRPSARLSPVPLFIQRDETLSAAHRAMREHRIRHLPVMDGRRFVGIVSARDLHLVETLRDVDPRVLEVHEAMTPDRFTSPSAAAKSG